MMPTLRELDVVIGVLDEAKQDVSPRPRPRSGLGEAGGVADGAGHVQVLGQRLRR
jgi:hypothetical protein